TTQSANTRCLSSEISLSRPGRHLDRTLAAACHADSYSGSAFCYRRSRATTLSRLHAILDAPGCADRQKLRSSSRRSQCPGNGSHVSHHDDRQCSINRATQISDAQSQPAMELVGTDHVCCQQYY